MALYISMRCWTYCIGVEQRDVPRTTLAPGTLLQSDIKAGQAEHVLHCNVAVFEA